MLDCTVLQHSLYCAVYCLSAGRAEEHVTQQLLLYSLYSTVLCSASLQDELRSYVATRMWSPMYSPLIYDMDQRFRELQRPI